MLTTFQALRSPGSRVLLVASTIVTTALLLWMHLLRLSGDLHGLAPSFFVLFAHYDYSGAVCALLILFGAIFLSPYLPAVHILRWAGEHPLVIAAISVPFLASGSSAVRRARSPRRGGWSM